MKAAIHFQRTGSLPSESLLKNMVTHSVFLRRKAGSINFSLSLQWVIQTRFSPSTIPKHTVHPPTMSKLQNTDGNGNQCRLSPQIKCIVKLQTCLQLDHANKTWCGRVIQTTDLVWFTCLKPLKNETATGQGYQLRDCSCIYREDTLFPCSSCISSSEDLDWNSVKALDSGFNNTVNPVLILQGPNWNIVSISARVSHV